MDYNLLSQTIKQDLNKSISDDQIKMYAVIYDNIKEIVELASDKKVDSKFVAVHTYLDNNYKIDINEYQSVLDLLYSYGIRQERYVKPFRQKLSLHIFMIISFFVYQFGVCQFLIFVIFSIFFSNIYHILASAIMNIFGIRSIKTYFK